MATSPESMKLGADDATDTTSSLHPHPHPHPPLHPQWPQPPHPSAPPPDYGQAINSKAYEASNTTGPYLYAAIQANQPQQMLLPPYPQTSEGQAHQVVLIEKAAVRSDQHRPSFLAHFVLSCFVFWCCGWMFGCIAFVIAVMAQNSVASGDVTGARRLGYISLGLSICGFVTGAVVTIVFVVQAVQKEA